MLLKLAFPRLGGAVGAFRKAPELFQRTAGNTLQRMANTTARMLEGDVKRLMAETQATAAGARRADQVIRAATAPGYLDATMKADWGRKTALAAQWEANQAANKVRGGPPRKAPAPAKQMAKMADRLGMALPGYSMTRELTRGLQAQARKQGALVKLANRIARMEGNKRAAQVAARKEELWARAIQAGVHPARRVGRPQTRVLWDAEREAKLARLKSRYLVFRAKAETFNTGFSIGGSRVWIQHGPEVVKGEVVRQAPGWRVKVHGPKWAGCPQSLVHHTGNLLLRGVRRSMLGRIAMDAIRRAG